MMKTPVITVEVPDAMVKPVRVQRKREKGWKLPPNTVCVDSSTQWGNPFHVGPDFRPVDIFDLFKTAIEMGSPLLKFRKADLWKLRGKNLACFCPTDSPYCHANHLLTLANEGISHV